MTDINELRRQFAIPGVVHIEPGHGRLPRISIMTDQAEAHVYLHGAHITHYRPRAGQDVLFLSTKSHFEPGKAIRGGVPVIFPWFGPKADNPSAPAHGFVRTKPWDLVEVSQSPDRNVTLVLETVSDKETMAAWPGEFHLRYSIVVGSSLEMALEVRNTSHTTFTYESALHTYLAVDDVKRVAISGLANCQYLDKTDSMRRRTEGTAPIVITSETDRVYVNTRDTVMVDDPVLARRLVVEKEGSRSTVVWNPWVAKAKALPDFGDDEWPHMLCIETATVGENAITLAAGESHRMVAHLAWRATSDTEHHGSTKQWEMSASPGGRETK